MVDVLKGRGIVPGIKVREKKREKKPPRSHLGPPSDPPRIPLGPLESVPLGPPLEPLGPPLGPPWTPLYTLYTPSCIPPVDPLESATTALRGSTRSRLGRRGKAAPGHYPGHRPGHYPGHRP
eukprot:1192586-Prorocentrum_minimum.AAC.1